MAEDLEYWNDFVSITEISKKVGDNWSGIQRIEWERGEILRLYFRFCLERFALGHFIIIRGSIFLLIVWNKQ